MNQTKKRVSKNKRKTKKATMNQTKRSVKLNKKAKK